MYDICFSVVNNFWTHRLWRLLDPPTLEVGPLNSSMCVRTYVRNVRTCVCSEFFSKTRHRIFLKFGMKLKDHNRKNVTEPDFSGKIWFLGKSGKSAKKCGFSYFSRKRVIEYFWNSLNLFSSVSCIIQRKPHVWEKSGSRDILKKALSQSDCPIFQISISHELLK